MEPKEEKTKVKKGGNKAGERTQRMMSFRVDNEVAKILGKFKNKGRFLNNLVLRWYNVYGKDLDEERFLQWSQGEFHPDESSQSDEWLT